MKILRFWSQVLALMFASQAALAYDLTGCSTKFGLAGSAATSSGAPVKRIKISMLPVPISPLLYGVTYNWDVNPAQSFPQWAQAMQYTAQYRMAQFGGGWNAEHYEWGENQCPAYCENTDCYDPCTQSAGVDPSTFAAMVPKAQFIIPDMQVVQADNQEKRDQAIATTVTTATAIVTNYSRSGGASGSHAVKSYIIGNEWWIERGALKDSAKTAENLSRYGQLVKAVVPAMKRVDSSIELYALADWLHPEQYAELRKRVGEDVWRQLDGVAIHAYTQTVGGYGEHKHVEIAKIASQIQLVRWQSGKDKIFDSQWSLTPTPTDVDAPPAYGLSNANFLVLAFQQLVYARVQGAMIWPAVGFVGQADFFDWKISASGARMGGQFEQPHASGILFGWLSKYYEGQALQISGDMNAVAAQTGNGKDRRLSIIVPSLGSGLVHVIIPLDLTQVHQIDSAEVMYSDHPEDKNLSRLVHCVKLPAFLTLDNNRVNLHFFLNPGGAKRGVKWEIARVTLKE